MKSLKSGGQDVLADPVDVNNSLITQLPAKTVISKSFNPVRQFIVCV